MGALFLYSCEKDSTEVIDPNYSAPSISNFTITPDTVNTTSASPQVNFTVSASVTSNNSISSVTASVFNPNNEAAGEFSLTSNGNGTYSANISLSGIQCLLVGNYKVQLVAEDAQGLFSNVVILNLPVRNTANQAPVLSGLIAPDTIIIPSSGTDIYVLSIIANDPDGYCDLQTVFFNSFLPNGQPSSGNPFTMFDDGNIELHGDTVAMDSRFSLKVGIPSTITTTGYYVFRYNATDRSGVTATELVDSILVRFP